MVKRCFHNFHYAATAILALALIPALRAAHLPLKFAWTSYFVTYWWSLGFQSMTAAILLYAIGFPSEFRQKLTSRVSQPENPMKETLAIFIPATYLFVMFFLVFSYNDIIASLRFNGSADLALNNIDSWILRGLTVSSLAAGIPLGMSKAMEVIYFSMFSQMGACLILLALRCGRKISMRFISTIVTAYYIALIAFYFIPATGPYYLSAMNHDGNYIGLGQRAFVQMLNALRSHQRPPIIGTDYFIALPCLHVTQPLIALWFIRRWKRVLVSLSVYCCVLFPSIVLLEQHYVIDLVGGVAVAIISIAAVEDASSDSIGGEAAKEPDPKRAADS